MSNSTDDFLLGGGSKSAKFDNIGDTITGTIESTEVKQQTDIADGSPLTWPNGDPKMQLVVTLATNLRDPDIEDDDGLRSTYVKGSKKAGTRSTHDAVASAVRASGAKGLAVGGTLTLTYVGDEPSQTRGFSPRKLWSATYAAPDQATTTGGFLGTTPTQAPVQQPAAPLPMTLTPEMAAAYEQYQRAQAAQQQNA